MRTTTLLVVFVAALLAACAGGGQTTMTDRAPARAELVLHGGRVLTMDPARPDATAIAVVAGRVAVVGSDADALAFVGPDTRVIDLAGRTVTPGLVDGHCHLFGLGREFEQLSFRGLDSAAAVAAVVARAAKTRPAGEWLLGRGWDQNRWTPAEFPTRGLLDIAAPAHPVAIRRIDGHALWVNGAALAAAAIDSRTSDPAGGRIVRDARGEPTGVLIDNAADLVFARLPPDSAEARARQILAGATRAVAAGLTGVHEMGIDDATVAVYRKLVAEGRLPLRVYAFLQGEGQLDTLAARVPDRDPDGTARFVLRAVKLYADGALGSRGAALLAPYADDPGNVGLVLATEAELAHAVDAAVASGWQLGVHAIGDRANRMVLDAFARAVGGDRRFRIEHAQVVAPEDLGRFAALGVAAAMQPTHATSDMAWADERLGPARLVGAYAWRTLLASGAHVIGGSDFPIEDVPPLLGLYAAVTRMDAKGNPPGGWLPDERLTLEQALSLYTVEPAWAAFAERQRGRIALGFVADLTVFDGPLAPDRSLLERQVDLTIVGGSVVYARAAR